MFYLYSNSKYKTQYLSALATFSIRQTPCSFIFMGKENLQIMEKRYTDKF